MEKKKKVRCDCGAHLEERLIEKNSLRYRAMVCPRCRFRALTEEQAKEYIKLKNLQEAIKGAKKVIKIGNSMGIILPDALKRFGVRIGKKLKVEVIDSKSFRIYL